MAPPPTLKLTTIYGHPHKSAGGASGANSVAAIAGRVSLHIERSRTSIKSSSEYRSAGFTGIIVLYQLLTEAGGTFGNQWARSGNGFSSLPASAYCYRDSARTQKISLGDGKYQMDPADPAYRAFVRDEMQWQRAQYPALDGHFFDNIRVWKNQARGGAIYPGSSSRNGGNAYTDATMHTQEVAMMQYLRDNVVLGTGQYNLMGGNWIHQPTTPNWANDYKMLDYGFDEQLNGWPQTSGFDGASRVDGRINAARNWLASGANKFIVMCAQMRLGGDANVNRYGMATALMMQPTGTAQTATINGRSVPRVVYRPATESDYLRWYEFDDLNVNLGTPTADPVRQSAGNWYRDFQAGRVTINVSTKTGTLTVTGTPDNPPPPEPAPTDPAEPPPPEPTPTDPIPPVVVTDPPIEPAETMEILLPLGETIRGLTVARTEERLHIFTNTIKTYRWEPGGTVTAGPDLGTAANRAIRSGEGEFVYVATDGALMKVFENNAFDVRLMGSLQQALAVGYSSAGKIVAAPEQGGTEYLIPTNSTSNQPGVWHYKNGSWTLKATGLPTGVTWFQVVASPLNPDHWAAFAPEGAGGSAVWITLDAGATWQSAGVPGRSVHPPLTAMTSRFEWREDDEHEWVAIFGTIGGVAHFVYGRGITTTATYGFSYKDVFVAIPAANGEVFRYNDFGNSYIRPDGTTAGVSGRTALIGRHEWGDHDGGTSLRLAQSARQEGLRVVGTTDYRVNGTDSVLLKTTDAGAYWINFAAGTVYYVIQERIRRLVNPFTAPVESLQTTARGVRCLRQARQARLTTVNMAGRSHGTVDAPFDGLEVSSDGTAWTSLAGPSGVTGLVDWVEVITRAGATTDTGTPPPVPPRT